MKRRDFLKTLPVLFIPATLIKCEPKIVTETYGSVEVEVDYFGDSHEICHVFKNKTSTKKFIHNWKTRETVECSKFGTKKLKALSFEIILPRKDIMVFGSVIDRWADNYKVNLTIEYI